MINPGKIGAFFGGEMPRPKMPSEKTWHKLRLIVFGALTLMAIYNAWNAAEFAGEVNDNRDDYPEYWQTECGKVHDKFVATSGETSVYVEEYLVIKYPDRYERKNVSENTYYSSKVGERICFWVRGEKSSPDGWVVLHIVLSIAFGVTFGVSFDKYGRKY